MRARTVGAVVAAAVLVAAGVLAVQAGSPEPAPAPEPVDYVALGDSFSAGPLVPEARSDPPGLLPVHQQLPGLPRGVPRRAQLPRRHLLGRPDPGPPAAAAAGVRPDHPAPAGRALRPAPTWSPSASAATTSDCSAPSSGPAAPCGTVTRAGRRAGDRSPAGSTADRSTPRRATLAGSRTGWPGRSVRWPGARRRPRSTSWGTHGCCRSAARVPPSGSPPVTTRGASGSSGCSTTRCARRRSVRVRRSSTSSRLPRSRRLRGAQGLAQREPDPVRAGRGVPPVPERDARDGSGRPRRDHGGAGAGDDGGGPAVWVRGPQPSLTASPHDRCPDLPS